MRRVRFHTTFDCGKAFCEYVLQCGGSVPVRRQGVKPPNAVTMHQAHYLTYYVEAEWDHPALDDYWAEVSKSDDFLLL